MDLGAYLMLRTPTRSSFCELANSDPRAGHLDLGQELAAAAALNVYVLADLDQVLRTLGDRGYRVAQLEASIISGKLYLASYARNLAATGLTFFDDEVVRFFRPAGRGKERHVPDGCRPSSAATGRGGVATHPPVVPSTEIRATAAKVTSAALAQCPRI